MLSWRADPRGRRLADRHYPRRSVGAPQFVQAGACLVLVTVDGGAVWVTSVQRFAKHKWPGAWVNSLFRRERGALASELIVEAVAATVAELGPPPPLGMVTFIDPTAVRHKRDPGRCYRRAGFVVAGETPGGHGRPPLLVLRLPAERMPPPAEPLRRQLVL